MNTVSMPPLPRVEIPIETRPWVGLAKVTDGRAQVNVRAMKGTPIILQEDFTEFAQIAIKNGLVAGGIPVDDVYAPEVFPDAVLMPSLQSALVWKEGFLRRYEVNLKITIVDKFKEKVFEKTYPGFSQAPIFWIQSSRGKGASFAGAVEDAVRRMTGDPVFLDVIEVVR